MSQVETYLFCKSASLPVCPSSTNSLTHGCYAYLLSSSYLPESMPGTAAAAAKSLQLCPTLCDPIDGSPPGSPVPGILQTRTLEWIAISFSNAWKWKLKVKSLSRVRLLTTPWTAAFQAPLSMGFSRQEYWSGVPLPSPSAVPTWSNKCLFSEWYFLTEPPLLQNIYFIYTTHLS